MSIALTFDLEKDANLSSTFGITAGLKKIVKILKKHSIKSTFFVTSFIAENFPEIIKKLSENHEIGCHGHIHKKYTHIKESDKIGIQNSKNLLEEITGREVIGFRAPMLYTSPELYKIINDLQFKYDASGKPNSKLNSIYDLKIFKVSQFNVYFRFPFLDNFFKRSFLKTGNSIYVLYFHPWEAISMVNLYLKHQPSNLLFRLDRWVSTGDIFIRKLDSFIKYLLKRGFEFKTLSQIYHDK